MTRQMSNQLSACIKGLKKIKYYNNNLKKTNNDTKYVKIIIKKSNCKEQREAKSEKNKNNYEEK